MSIPIQAQEAFNHLLDWLKREPWKSRFHQFSDETILELADINGLDVNELAQLAETGLSQRFS